MKLACQTRWVGSLLAAVMMLGHVGLGAASAGDEALKALDLRQVKLGGEIGRRIDVTVRNNLLVLDAEKDFLAHFRAKTMHEGYIGLGKLVDAAVRLAAYTNDEKVIALKQRLVDETIKTQGPDGYIGAMAVPNRMWGLWDIHEMGYIIYALAERLSLLRPAAQPGGGPQSGRLYPRTLEAKAGRLAAEISTGPPASP